MIWFSQYKDGIMIAWDKDKNKFYKVNTGYPYPDVYGGNQLDNIYGYCDDYNICYDEDTSVFELLDKIVCNAEDTSLDSISNEIVSNNTKGSSDIFKSVISSDLSSKNYKNLERVRKIRNKLKICRRDDDVMDYLEPLEPSCYGGIYDTTFSITHFKYCLDEDFKEDVLIGITDSSDNSLEFVTWKEMCNYLNTGVLINNVFRYNDRYCIFHEFTFKSGNSKAFSLLIRSTKTLFSLFSNYNYPAGSKDDFKSVLISRLPDNFLVDGNISKNSSILIDLKKAYTQASMYLNYLDGLYPNINKAMSCAEELLNSDETSKSVVDDCISMLNNAMSEFLSDIVIYSKNNDCYNMLNLSNNHSWNISIGTYKKLNSLGGSLKLSPLNDYSKIKVELYYEDFVKVNNAVNEHKDFFESKKANYAKKKLLNEEDSDFKAFKKYGMFSLNDVREFIDKYNLDLKLNFYVSDDYSVLMKGRITKSGFKDEGTPYFTTSLYTYDSNFAESSCTIANTCPSYSYRYYFE